MFNRALFALCVFVLCLGFAAADEIKGKFSKIDDKSVTVTPAGASEAKTYTLAKDCKFYKTVKKTKQEITDGVKADDFKNPPKKGLNLSLTTNDKNEVTEVLIVAKKKVVQ